MTAVLAAVGALAGACGGTIAILCARLFMRFSRELGSFEGLVGLAAAVGSILGAFVAPPLTWAFLRFVPVWRAALETAFLGTLGFLLTFLLLDRVDVAIIIALTATGLATARLRYAFRGSAREAREPVSNVSE